MTTHDVVQAQVDAFNARDAKAFAQFYSHDAQVLGSDGTVMVAGRDAIRSFYGGLFDASPDLHVAIGARIVAGDFVVDEESVSGIAAEGMPPELHAAIVYRIKDDLIEHAQMLM